MSPTTRFTVLIENPARKRLLSIPRDDAKKILLKISDLSVNPIPRGSKKLSGLMNSFRIRSGVYRVIYFIDFDNLTVKIADVGHRKDVYKKL